MALKRISMNLEEKLLEKVDNYADEIGLNRTGAVSAILGNFFRENQTLAVMSEMLVKMGEMGMGKEKNDEGNN